MNEKLALVPNPARSPMTEFVHVQAAVLEMRSSALKAQLLDVLKTNYPYVVDEEIGDV